MAFYTSTITSAFRSRSGAEGLELVAKRYVPEQSAPTGLTLLLFHCTGSHKEVWEPTIQHLFAANDTSGTDIIREAWAFDMQNCGEAAVVNASALSDELVVSVEDWAAGIKAFIATGILEGRKLVGVGHSGGCCCVAHTTNPEGLPAVRYQAIVLIEPSVSERATCYAHWEENMRVNAAMVKAIESRTILWADREEARVFFAKRLPWKLWDPRVVDLFVRHGLTDVPARDGDVASKKVTLCCSTKQEKSQYQHYELYLTAVDFLAAISPTVPVHFITGVRADLVPPWAVQSTRNACKVSSSQDIPGAGHFVVQENPAATAGAMISALRATSDVRARM